MLFVLVSLALGLLAGADDHFEAADSAVKGDAGVADGAEDLVKGAVRVLEPHEDFTAFLPKGLRRLAAFVCLAMLLEIEEELFALAHLFDEFAAVLSSADAVVLTEVYAAGEAPVVGADAKSLARAIRARGRIDPVVVGSAADLPGLLGDVLRDGDLLLVMGAGDIGHVANDIAVHGFTGAAKS